jgi:hypothetical protein
VVAEPEKEKLVEGYLLVVLCEPVKPEENLLLREKPCDMAGEVRSRVMVG